MVDLKALRYQKALLDANLLLPYLIQQSGIDTEKFERTKDFTQEDAQQLDELVTKCEGLCFTPHVITEVSNLAGKLRDVQRKSFRNLLARYIEKCEEFSISSKELVYYFSPIYLKFGITDAALFAICQRKKNSAGDIGFSISELCREK